MKKLTIALFALIVGTSLHADISMPKKDNFYDKFGRGVANIATAPTEILDSIYYYNETEGGTVGFCKGITQGVSRTLMDIGHGTFDIVTAPLPVGPYFSYRTWKSRPWNSMVVNDYPPGDLTNWY